jgi:hypothetical protein
VLRGILAAMPRPLDDTARRAGLAWTYAELKAKGVEFLSPPDERPYGVEAMFRDDSGNWFSLTQH